MASFIMRWSAAGLLAVAGSAPAGAEPVTQDLEREARRVVALDAQVGDRALQGAGVVVARERDAVIVVTANHVVRQGETGASSLTARFKSLPNQRLAARLLPSFDRASDLALLRIDGLRAAGIDPCGLPAPRFEPTLAVQRGHGVYAIGNPSGIPWRVPVAPDEVAEVNERDIRFQSAVIESGHSGGALFDAFGDLVGIVRSDQPPYGVAVRLDVVLRLLRGWGVAVQTARESPPGTDADPCGRPPEAAVAAPAAVARSADALPTDPEAWFAGYPADGSLRTLFLAVQRGDVAEVRRLTTPAALDTDGYHPPFPLHWAAAFGQVGVVKQLLLTGAKKNSFVWVELPGDPIGTKWGTPLHLAARANQAEVIKVLVAAGASLEEGAGMTDGTGTPLVVAVRHGHLEAARALIAAGADLKAGGRYSEGWRRTPLATAVANGRIDMIKLLQTAKAPLSEPRGQGGPPALLRVAVAADRLDALRYLLSQHVPLECGGEALCDTPLYGAVNEAKLEAARLLLDAGADRNRSTSTPYLHLAIERDNLAMLRLLLKAGADASVKDREGRTALAYAQQRDNADAVALLRASGAKR